jgi:hypothetical protein
MDIHPKAEISDVILTISAPEITAFRCGHGKIARFSLPLPGCRIKLKLLKSLTSSPRARCRRPANIRIYRASQLDGGPCCPRQPVRKVMTSVHEAARELW